jgi:2-iminobutanoate/2-iminopropanoate deaminase
MATTTTTTMTIEYPVPPDVSTTQLPFSPATKVGNLIFVSGQVSSDPKTGEIIHDGFENQFRRTVENVRRILRACGSDLDKVAQVKSYVKNPEHWEEYNTLYREYFPRLIPRERRW